MFEYALAAIPGNSPPGNIVMDEFAHEFFLTSLDEAATGNGTTNSPASSSSRRKSCGISKLWLASRMAESRNFPPPILK